MFVLFINICAFAKVDIPNHTDRFFINDYANVIDSETEDYIFEKGKAYNANGGPQVVVLTMESIDGNDLEDFSIETARKWGIGDKDADNGVLILLVMDSRDIRNTLKKKVSESPRQLLELHFLTRLRPPVSVRNMRKS